MLKLKFNDTNRFYDIEFARYENHIVKVIGEEIPQNTSGFIIYNEDGIEFLGDGSTYKTIYKIENDGILFSNNGSVYEPRPEELPDTPKQQHIAVIFDYNMGDLAQIPDIVNITYLIDDEEFETAITSMNDWQETITIKNAQTLTVNGFEELENFEGHIFENSIIYEGIGPFDSTIRPQDEEIPDEIMEEDPIAVAGEALIEEE